MEIYLSSQGLEAIIILCGLAFTPVVVLGTALIEDMKERKLKREKREDIKDIRKS